MLVGPRSTIVRVNYNCLLDFLTTPYQKDVFFSNGRRKPKKKSLFKKKCKAISNNRSIYSQIDFEMYLSTGIGDIPHIQHKKIYGEYRK